MQRNILKLYNRVSNTVEFYSSVLGLLEENQRGKLGIINNEILDQIDIVESRMDRMVNDTPLIAYFNDIPIFDQFCNKFSSSVKKAYAKEALQGYDGLLYEAVRGFISILRISSKEEIDGYIEKSLVKFDIDKLQAELTEEYKIKDKKILDKFDEMEDEINIIEVGNSTTDYLINIHNNGILFQEGDTEVIVSPEKTKGKFPRIFRKFF